MKVNLNSKIFALPLLACSTWAYAVGPVELDAAAMDHITAGSQPVLERIADVLATVPRNPGNLNFGDLLPLLGGDRLALLTKLASGEPITFRLVNLGELVATHQLQSGEQLVLVKQLSVPEAASLRSQSPGDNVTTYLLNPGESLHVQQTSSGPANYLYIHSPGNSSVTTTQKTGL
jgi:hypothetical protein